MSIYFGSFGGIKLHADTHLLGGSDEITGELNPLIYAQIDAQHIVTARNNIGAVTASEAQSWINGLGNLLNNVAGVLQVYFPNDDVLHSHDAEVTEGSSTATKKKTITLNVLHKNPSILHLTFDLKTSADLAYARIHRNGAAVGSMQASGDSTYSERTLDLEFAPGDTLELWLWSNTGESTAYARNFRIRGKVDVTLSEAIAIDSAGVDVAFVATNS